MIGDESFRTDFIPLGKNVIRDEYTFKKKKKKKNNGGGDKKRTLVALVREKI